MLEKHKDTLFIDMKYIILYRKLGYIEVAPDLNIAGKVTCYVRIKIFQSWKR